VNKCGNSIVDLNQGEVCDNGANGADGCSDDCKTVQDGWNCNKIDGKSGRCTPICGDGKLVGIETQAGRCDDGNLIPSDGCSTICVVNPGYTCTGTPSDCTPICGDGKLVGNEALAGGCDDANTNTGDGCESCQTIPLYSCTGAPSVCVKLCGNKRWNVIAGEDCDNGPSTNNDDGCDDNDCTIQDGWYCEHVEFGPSTCTT
jgi:cysteine-rich repeat protein